MHNFQKERYYQLLLLLLGSMVGNQLLLVFVLNQDLVNVVNGTTVGIIISLHQITVTLAKR